MVTTALLYAGFVPLAVAAAAAFAAQRLRAPAPVAWSVGAGLGYIAGHIGLASLSGISRALRSVVSPRDAVDWLPGVVLLAMGVTVLAVYAPRRWQYGVVGLAALLTSAVPARVLAGPVAQNWSMLEKVSRLGLLAATLSLVWLLLATAPEEPLSRLRQVLLVLSSVGAAVVATLSGSFTLGRLCGALAAALVGTALVAPRGVSGAAGVVACALGGLIIAGVYYANLQTVNAALLLASIASVGRLPDAVSARPASQQAVLRAALCLVPLTIALARCLA